MQKKRAKEQKTEGAQFEEDPGESYPRGDRGFNMGFRQSYVYQVKGPFDYKR